ncbi:nucleotidyltransferase domain-containing protein [Chlorobaculum sp. 24CR]|uniref:nucleotidyltransferase domain-containing protein n=1 Tax=Chlorobaculum sp. 24CR TaxID=2508878 RepID=UPI00100B6570|nr:nucleotidyltransferase domain-containing protein [Chlorobaculum sp. 24CR]RXK87961.1 nucleotidyltransferase domain-containing protein [Chlorobaculum sp. 24CR]
MKYGLDGAVIARIQGVLARYPQVDRAMLYGSRAMGNYRPGSDIDLTLVGSEALNLKILYRIMDEIDDLLLPYTFDLSVLRLINDREVREHIRRAGVVFYDKAADSSSL